MFNDDGTINLNETSDIHDDPNGSSYTGTYVIKENKVIVTIPSHICSPFTFDYENGKIKGLRAGTGYWEL